MRLHDLPCQPGRWHPCPAFAKAPAGVLSPDQAARCSTRSPEDPRNSRLRDVRALHSSGLRLSELAGLNLAQGWIWRLARSPSVASAARPASCRWAPRHVLHCRPGKICRGALAAGDEPALFVSQRGGRLFTSMIGRRLDRWAQKQGMNVHVHPHMLRHSFASHLLQSSSDLRAVQELLGHASIRTTQIYTHLDFQHLAKTYDAAHPRTAQADKALSSARRHRGSVQHLAEQIEEALIEFGLGHRFCGLLRQRVAVGRPRQRDRADPETLRPAFRIAGLERIGRSAPRWRRPCCRRFSCPCTRR